MTIKLQKIILSRKRFDSGYGKMPSLILPDGTFLKYQCQVQREQM